MNNLSFNNPELKKALNKVYFSAEKLKRTFSAENFNLKIDKQRKSRNKIDDKAQDKKRAVNFRSETESSPVYEKIKKQREARENKL